MRVGELALIGLDAVGRRISPFGSAPDIHAETVVDGRFAGQQDRSNQFDRHFCQPLDVAGKVVLETGVGHGGMQVELLRREAAKTIALDIDPWFLEETRKRVAGDSRVEFVHAPIEECPLPDESVDVVVSDSVFEHLSDVPASLNQLHRVLRPGGLVYITFGCTWLHFNGPHLITYLHVPWVQVFFSEKTIVSVLERYKAEGRYPAASIDGRLEDFKRMNKLSLRQFRKLFDESGLDVLQFDNINRKPWKQRLSRLPGMGEVFEGELVVVLRKPL
jgi:ubiquinone/menaquinone biosynthesis C-methylase UbiE